MARLARNLSPIGFGAFKIGRNEGTKYPSGYALPDAAAVARLLSAVLDMGINYIDTAPAYGLSEERIGRAIGHRKPEFLLSTKVGETFHNGTSEYDFSERGVRASIDASRTRLRVERLDLVFIHASRDDARVLRETDVVATLRDLRDEGVVGAAGLSGYTEAAFRVALDWADAIMVEYHPNDRSLGPIMAEAAERGIAVMIKKALAAGRLKPEDALPFILRNPAVTSVVVGSLDPDHLREDLRLAQAARASVGHAPDPKVSL